MNSQPRHSPVYDFSGLGFQRGDVLIVTGGGSGIGAAIATAAAHSGLTVAIWDRDGDAAAASAMTIGAAATAITCDIGSADEVDAAWKATAALGACRYLVNNAGPGSSVPGFDANVAVSVGGTHRVTDGWLSRAVDQAIAAVNIVSVVGTFHGGHTQSHYPTAKGAIAALTRHLAVRHGGRPRFNAVAPGFTLTPRTLPYLERAEVRERVARVPMGRMGWPEEVAAATLFLLSPAAGYVNGAVLPVDGGWTLA